MSELRVLSEWQNCHYFASVSYFSVRAHTTRHMSCRVSNGRAETVMSTNLGAISLVRNSVRHISSEQRFLRICVKTLFTSASQSQSDNTLDINLWKSLPMVVCCVRRANQSIRLFFLHLSMKINANNKIRTFQLRSP